MQSVPAWHLYMFDEQYPNLAAWILDGDCWVELGTTDYSRSTVRILDIGGMIWESERSYASVAAALADAEQALAAWLAEHGLPVKRSPGA